MTRVCRKCKAEKPLTTGFFKHPQGKYGYRATCKECKRQQYLARRCQILEAARIRRKGNKPYRRNWNLKHLYGITLTDFEAMLANQDGKCAVCKTSNPGRHGTFNVDHCHVTGKIRGLLCDGCNRGLGFLGDDPLVIAQRLFRYAGTSQLEETVDEYY